MRPLPRLLWLLLLGLAVLAGCGRDGGGTGTGGSEERGAPAERRRQRPYSAWLGVSIQVGPCLAWLTRWGCWTPAKAS